VIRRAFSKPDSISPTLELRRMAIPGGDREWQTGDWVTTDFYELYWAHLMAGTAWRHVTAWAWPLLVRWPGKVPPRLKWPWRISWAVLLIAVGVNVLIALQAWMNADRWPLVLIFVGITLALLGSIVRYVGLGYVGDAARYLSATPANVAVRQAIRSAAIDLLEGLHDDPSWRRYHRIILVGHSLGSVIGYDALTHLWQRRHHPPDTQPIGWGGQPTLQKYKGILKDPTSLTDKPQELQSALWREQRDVGIRWKITDFVTLGSPLAHAAVLMAKDEDELKERVEQREYPSCPPQAEDPRDSQYSQSLLITKTGCEVLHHAAPFACTRWTNLYFDRDFIGGPIKSLGCWIVNQPVPPAGSFPHTEYWHDKGAAADLCAALDLKGWWKTEANALTALSAQDRDSALMKSEQPQISPR